MTIDDLDDFKTINGQYPHIGVRLQAMWGKGEFAKLIADLTGSHTGGDGFPTAIRLCLKNLEVVHAKMLQAQQKVGAAQVQSDNEHIRLIQTQYPRVGAQLAEKWGTAEFPPFLNSLMNDSRGGKRAGFSPEAATALFHLMMQHDQEFPQFELKVNDIWSLHDDGSQGDKDRSA
jgi:hypothetical protein